MQSQVSTETLPLYDATILRDEMNLFTDWFLQRHLRITLSDRAQQVLQNTFAALIDNAEQQPAVFVHRDYHSRNLMLCDTANPGILDFQDAVRGPITYDLVSLLRDCYIAWPKADVKRWVQEYHSRIQSAGLLSNDLQTFERWFDWMGVQRHLKAIGIFARLNHRDGKSVFLNDIPRTYNYLTEICKQYTELAEFVDLLQQLLVEQRINESTR